MKYSFLQSPSTSDGTNVPLEKCYPFFLVQQLFVKIGDFSKGPLLTHLHHFPIFWPENFVAKDIWPKSKVK